MPTQLYEALKLNKNEYWLVEEYKRISPGNLKALWLPRKDDTTTTISLLADRTYTYDATIASRKSYKGKGVVVSFSGTGQYALAPDTTDLDYGNGSIDSAFSVVSFANVTDTAAARTMASKWDGTGSKRQWQFTIRAADTLALFLADESATVTPDRTSNAAITQAAWQTFGATYDGTGGATACNGIVLYANGASIASTATNNAGYVAMEALVNSYSIGSISEGAGQLFNGSMGLVALYSGVLSLTQMRRIHLLHQEYFEIA